MRRLLPRVVLAGMMLTAGVLHFVRPEGFVAIVPDYLPAHRALVSISGVAELLGGLGLLLPPTRRMAAWGLIALYVAVFPANVNMAVHGLGLPPGSHAGWVLWARLPLQLLLMGWAYLYTRP